MKNIIYGIVVVLLGLLLTVIILIVNGRTTRDKDLYSSLAQSVETAVENTIENNNYTIENNEEFKADFIQNLLIELGDDVDEESTTDIKVDIEGIDYEKGMLSVTVTETFKETLKKDPKKIVYSTTVILEKMSPEKEYIVTFRGRDNELLRKYTYVEGSPLAKPEGINPGYEVKSWLKEVKDSNGNIIENSVITNFDNIKVDNNMTFYAQVQ